MHVKDVKKNIEKKNIVLRATKKIQKMSVWVSGRQVPGVLTFQYLPLLFYHFDII